MSRLDDELRLLLRREEPSADFAERVLGRLNAPAPPRAGRWRRLLQTFQTPMMQWAAAGVGATLLAATLGLQFVSSRDTAIEDRPPDVAGTPTPAPATTPAPTPPVPTPAPVPEVKQVKHRAVPPRAPRQARPADNAALRAEAERAKAEVLRALAIAGATLNEAQKIIAQTE